jgi:hypothetical protein
MSSMRNLSMPMLIVAAVACGEVPHPPKRVLAVHDAGQDDVSLDDASDTDGPKRPLPLSEECTRCGSNSCLQVGAACVGDPVCQSCFADVLAPGCLDNQHLLNLGYCACTSACYDVCKEVCEATRDAWDTGDR